MTTRHIFEYKISNDSSTWLDVSPIVDSRKTQLLKSLCTDKLKSAVDEISFLCKPKSEGLELRKAVIDMLYEDVTTFVRVKLNGAICFLGHVDKSSFELTTKSLPQDFTIKCRDMSTLYLDDPVKAYIVYDRKKRSEIVVDLLNRAGYANTNIALDASDDDTITYVIDLDDDTSYRDHIDTILFEAGGYVLDFNTQGVAESVRIPWKELPAKKRIITDYLVSNGISTAKSRDEKDGLDIKWYTTAETNANQIVYSNMESEENEISGGGKVNGKKVNKDSYYPEDGDIEASYQEYSVDGLDRAYATGVSRKQNKDLSIIMVRDVSMAWTAFNSRGEKRTNPDPWCSLGFGTWTRDPATAGAGLLGEWTAKNAADNGTYKLTFGATVRYSYRREDGYLVLSLVGTYEYDGGTNLSMQFPDNTALSSDAIAISVSGNSFTFTGTVYWNFPVLPSLDMVSNPELYATKAQYLFHNVSGEDLYFYQMQIKGRVYYKKAKNTIIIPEGAFNTEEYDTKTIYSKENAERFSQFYWHLKKYARFISKWSDLEERELGEIVICAHKSTNIGQASIVVSKSLSFEGDILKVANTAIGMDSYSGYIMKSWSTDSGNATIKNVLYMKTQYAIGDNFDTPPVAGWTDERPSLENTASSSKVLWTRTEVEYSNGQAEIISEYPVSGKDGKDGLTEIAEYATALSATEPPAEEDLGFVWDNEDYFYWADEIFKWKDKVWTSTIPESTENEYVWKRFKTKETDPWQYVRMTGYIGSEGPQGPQGEQGAPAESWSVQIDPPAFVNSLRRLDNLYFSVNCSFENIPEPHLLSYAFINDAVTGEAPAGCVFETEEGKTNIFYIQPKFTPSRIGVKVTLAGYGEKIATIFGTKSVADKVRYLGKLDAEPTKASDTEGLVEGDCYYPSFSDSTLGITEGILRRYGTSGLWNNLQTTDIGYSEMVSAAMADVWEDIPTDSVIRAQWGYLKNIIAENIQAEMINSLLIYVRNAIYGGAFDANGVNTTGGKGFYLDKNGVARFVDAYMQKAVVDGYFICSDSQGVIMETTRGNAAINYSIPSGDRWSFWEAELSDTVVLDGASYDVLKQFYKKASSASTGTYIETTTGTFTIPYTGKYVFNFSIDSGIGRVYRNGSEITDLRVDTNDYAMNDYYAKGFKYYDLTAGDVLEIKLRAAYSARYDISYTEQGIMLMAGNLASYFFKSGVDYYIAASMVSGNWNSELHKKYVKDRTVYNAMDISNDNLVSTDTTKALYYNGSRVVPKYCIKTSDSLNITLSDGHIISLLSAANDDFIETEGYHNISGELSVYFKKRGFYCADLVPVKNDVNIGASDSYFSTSYISSMKSTIVDSTYLNGYVNGNASTSNPNVYKVWGAVAN